MEDAQIFDRRSDAATRLGFGGGLEEKLVMLRHTVSVLFQRSAFRLAGAC